MAGESTVLQSPGRKPNSYVDINYPVPYTCWPVGGSVPSGGSAQWSTPATTSGTASALQTLDFFSGDPLNPMKGRFDGVETGGIVEFGITVGIKSSAATPSAGIKLFAKNHTQGVYVQIDDNALFATPFALSTTEIEKTFSGRWVTTVGFNEVPFDLRVSFDSNNATALSIARVKSSSYVGGIIWPAK